MSSARPTGAVIVLTTIGTASDGQTLARTLVTERLAACVNLLPEMQSVYQWKGELTADTERQLIIKTTEGRLEALRSRLHQLHPYDVPEFLVIPVTEGSPEYLEWLIGNTAVDQ
jgi:periplasmic divalent cation tolerance protein